MFVERISYVDYDGNERTEDFRFNLSQAELMEMEFETPGGLEAMIKRIVDQKDVQALGKLFRSVILKSYGEKSPDGKRFVKSEDLSKAFSETEAYNQLYMHLIRDEAFANKFVSNLVPNVGDPNSSVSAPAIVR